MNSCVSHSFDIYTCTFVHTSVLSGVRVMNVCDHVFSCGIRVPVIPLTTVFFLDSVSFSNQMELDSAAKKVQFVLIVCLFVLIELCFDLIMSPTTYSSIQLCCQCTLIVLYH